MNWNEGFTGAYHLRQVDPGTWLDMGDFDIQSGKIDRIKDGLLESAAVEMQERPPAWVRIIMDAEQDGVEREALFTGLTSTPRRSIDGVRESFTVDCYSVLLPARVPLELGSYIPDGADAPEAVRKLLKATPAPVTISDDDHPRLTQSIVASTEDTALDMAWAVLSAVDWTMRIDGYGRITLQPVDHSPVAMMGAEEGDILSMEASDEQDTFSCPNCFRAIMGSTVAVARDDDPDSEYSTVTRGYEVWETETSVTLGTGESLAQYAMRRLRELQSAGRQISYTRRYLPDVRPGDCVRINYPDSGLDGIFEVTSQGLTLGYGCETEEGATLWATMTT